MRAIKVARYLGGSLLTWVGLASLQSDLATWWSWLKPFRKDLWPWTLLFLGLAILFGPTIWPYICRWIAERSGIVRERERRAQLTVEPRKVATEPIPFNAPVNADLEVILEREQFHPFRHKAIITESLKRSPISSGQ